uniref:Uncharacterized protein n=1 Tax=Haemonchus contortus TaxID=6289 RepID=U6Q0R4_HAECO|nr:unnamed protein product [Haemonchus contortus]
MRLEFLVLLLALIFYRETQAAPSSTLTAGTTSLNCTRFSSSTAATRNRTTAKCTKRVQSSCLPFIKKGYCTNPEMIECCPEHCRITC